MKTVEWTDERKAKLRSLARGGVTTREIANYFTKETGIDVTRNAIIGVMRRNEIINANPRGGNQESRKRPARTSTMWTDREDMVIRQVHSSSLTLTESYKAWSDDKRRASPIARSQEAYRKRLNYLGLAYDRHVIRRRQIKNNIAEEQDVLFIEPGPDFQHPLKSADTRRCMYPIGNPKSATFSYCQDKVELRQSYCKKHMAICYDGKPKRKKEPGQQSKFRLFGAHV